MRKKMMQHPLPLFSESAIRYRPEDIVRNVRALIRMHKEGRLGGAVMPEDARPDSIPPNSADNYHFLTLPMALNYQRNSYALWKSAATTYLAPTYRDVFRPRQVVNMPEGELREKLLTFRLAIQTNRHPLIWRRISEAIVDLLDGDIRNLFIVLNNDVLQIKEFVQKQHKKRFPYLSGEKICNYWLYVIDTYTPTALLNRHKITIAPDTHVIKASVRLGLIPDEEYGQSHRGEVAQLWEEVLSGTGIAPIDVHTPLWLWSRAGFPAIELSDDKA